MACPTPGDFASCNPKCRCVGSSCVKAYNCNDPCGTGNIEDFDPATCSCPDTFISKPALFIAANHTFCSGGQNYLGWFRYTAYTLAQHERPILVGIQPYITRPCGTGYFTRNGLGIGATWSDGTSQSFLGGASYVTDHTISQTLQDWDWGDFEADYYFPLSITEY